jgi:hypothetical protein
MKSAAELAELRRRENKRDDCISGKGSKVFELLEGGTAPRGSPEGGSSMSLRTGFRRSHVVCPYYIIIYIRDAAR